MTNSALGWVSFGRAERCAICTDLPPDLGAKGQVHLADGPDSPTRICERTNA